MDTEKRQRYYCSREWGLKKKAVHARADGICERCHRNPIAAVHHLTYIRLYREKLEDLQGVCFPCHEFIHGHIDEDPAYDSQPVPMPPAATDRLVAVPCARCGRVSDLVGRSGRDWFCEPCSVALEAPRRPAANISEGVA